MKRNSQVEQDIVGMISKLQEQVTSLERKVDTLVSLSGPRPETKPIPQAASVPVSAPAVKPFQQPTASTFAQTIGRQENRFQHQSGPRQDNRFQNGNRNDNRFQNNNNARQDNRFGERVMHKAVCADCKKPCEVPFRPVEGRPIYCQGCFSRRKASGSFNVNNASRPRERDAFVNPTGPVNSTPVDRLNVEERKKPAAKKRTVEKKKPAAKKKKK